MNEKRKSPEKIDFKAFVDIFNTHGKKAAVKHVSDTYAVRYENVKVKMHIFYNPKVHKYYISFFQLNQSTLTCQSYL